jgi:hypothetical protein
MRLPLRTTAAALLALGALASPAHAVPPAEPLICVTNQMLSPYFPYGSEVWITTEGDVSVRVGYDALGNPVYELVYDCPPYAGT